MSLESEARKASGHPRATSHINPVRLCQFGSTASASPIFQVFADNCHRQTLLGLLLLLAYYAADGTIGKGKDMNADQSPSFSRNVTAIGALISCGVDFLALRTRSWETDQVAQNPGELPAYDF